MSNDLSNEPEFTNRVDRSAALGCFMLATLIVATTMLGIVDLLRGCSDTRHGCANFIIGLPVAVGMAVLCAGAGYWLWPKHRESRKDHAS
jgi:hypothetical protein